MKKGLSIFAVLAGTAALTMGGFGSTYAKYTSNQNASDSARVAKWAFTVNNQDLTSASQTLTFDLFSTVKDSDKTTTEGDVGHRTGDTNTDKLIAPGTTGSFDLVLTNLSEVSANVKIDFTETNAGGIPIQYSLDGTNYVDSIDDLDLTKNANETGAININLNGADQTVTIYWRWAFEGDSTSATTRLANQTDATDTALGIVGTSVVTVKADITATQID